jgi:hypothetical protein
MVGIVMFLVLTMMSVILAGTCRPPRRSHRYSIESGRVPPGRLLARLLADAAAKPSEEREQLPFEFRRPATGVSRTTRALPPSVPAKEVTLRACPGPLAVV